MIKKTIKYFLYFLILMSIGIFYLSYYGIETNKFNKIIKDKITESSNKIDIELNKVKAILNLNNFTISIKTENPNIIVENNKIKLEKIETDFSINSFYEKKFAIKNVKITTKENSLKNISNIARIFKNTPQLFIFNKMVKGGLVIADINLNFDENGKLSNNYNVKGSVKGGKIKLLNKKNVNSISLNFNIKEGQYLIEDGQIEYEKLKLTSKKIKVENKGKYFLFKGNISSPLNLGNSGLLTVIFKNNLKNIGIDNINFRSENNFSFRLEKKFKISNFELDSKIDLKKLIYKKKSNTLKKYITVYNDSVELIDHKIDLSASKNKLSINGNGNFSIDEKIEKINYKINISDDIYNFKTQIELNNIPFHIKLFDYTKEEKENSLLSIEGSYKKNKKIYFKEILFKESKNNFKINNLSLSPNYKINFIEELNFDFLNDSKKKNKILFKKNNKNYELSGKFFDGTILLDQILESDNEENVFDILNDFNSNVNISINKVFIDKTNHLNNLNGTLKFKKSNLKNLNLSGNFFHDKKITFTINTNQNNVKITTLYSEYAKPLVKKYKFIKGFEEGYLDFYSLKKNNVSNSTLKISNFKIKELPALTKILTLASLQGIADLLTGEGIRFKEFEMKFKNENKVMTIDEIYAIGPAISLMMDGYVQKDKLISLRGTLVPATTLNKVIGSLPLVGDILVGKKTGEGVFGVSFKIKGPPKKTKTTVNPIKTLTPRFITRTIEKIKKN
tara:strand:+ start:251 stop:2455 length:2205 start_codon:yes stop_codon:yes gene_type:complete